MERKTDTWILIAALKILSRDIQSQDGVANAAILEGAQRIEELHEKSRKALDLVREAGDCLLLGSAPEAQQRIREAARVLFEAVLLGEQQPKEGV